MSRAKPVAFVTIGQSPREDILSEMLARIGPGIDPVEVGVLDGLTRDDVASLAPADGEHHLVSRLRDGTEVVLGKPRVAERLKTLFAELDARDPFLVVLLCTGRFEGLRTRALMLEAQRVVDHAVAALSEDGRAVGVMVPLAAQIAEFHLKGSDGRPVLYSHASPYSDDRLEAAARELHASDLIVMHCMGYSEAMRARVTEVSGKPVLLARRLVADAVAQLL